MSRKRFIKLAMAHGISRNEAYNYAIFVPIYRSYEGLYKSFDFDIITF